MFEVKLSTKGQLVIPVEVRNRHGWEPGARFDLEDRGDTLVLRPHRTPRAGYGLEDLLGAVAYEGPAVSVEAMDDAVRRAFKGDGR